jgi:SAM-dependent methyltransferase
VNTIFEQYYQNNFWGNTESVSGNGSDLKSTLIIRTLLPRLWRDLNIYSVLDAACGDMNWASRVKWPERYIGCDIVPELITENRRKYPEGEFQVLDITQSLLPKVDLIFARDVLVHFSNADVQRALRNIRASGAKFLMATTFNKHNNDDTWDITTGEWRPINMQQMWGLPRPELLINEGCDAPGFGDKSLGLWRLR